MKKKEILLITPECNTNNGGLAKSCISFVNILKSIGYNPIIVFSDIDSCLDKKKSVKVIKSNFIIMQGGYKPNLDKQLYFNTIINQVKEELEHNPPILIIAFGGGYNSLLAGQLQEIFNSKFIIMPRGSDFNLVLSDNDLFYTNYRSLKKADAVIALSNELLEKTKFIYFNPATKYQVIPNIIPKPKYLLKEKKSNNIILLGVGARHINEKKGVANLISAMRYLNNIDNKIKFHLEIIGDIDIDLKYKYKELSKELDIENYISFFNSLKKEEFIIKMKNWDIAIQSSFNEGCPNFIIESIYLGIPFITTNTGFIAETINIEVPSLIINDLSPEKIATKIYQAYFSDNFIGNQIKARNILLEKANEKNVISQWDKLLSSVTVSSNNKIRININQHIVSVIFHDISLENYSNIDIPLKDFTNLCDLVHYNGYKFVSAKQYFASENKEILIICTFDDSYLGVYQHAFPIMQKYNFTGTIFVCSEYIDIDNKWNKKDKFNRRHLSIQHLKQLENNNWEIGSHGTNHISMLRLNEEEIINTLKKSKIYLEKYFDNVVSFAYPYGDYNYMISKYAQKIYQNIFVVENGGTHIILDRHQIKRYSGNDIYHLLNQDN